jgi:hypothetical protein
MATFLTSQDNGDNDSGDGNNSNRDGDGDDDADSAMEQVPTVGEWAGCSRRFMAPIQISTRGNEILTDPLYNKGTAFKSGERDRLRFRGLLPPRVFNMELQKERFLLSLRAEESTIRKHLMLEDLHDRNETLYHRVLVSKNPHDSCFGWEGNLSGPRGRALIVVFVCVSHLFGFYNQTHTTGRSH